MLSSRTSERDVAAALGWGANDYLVKPFRPIELCARIRRLLKQAQLTWDGQERFGHWAFDRTELTLATDFSCETDQQRLRLTDREFRLAQTLFRSIGKVVSRAHLMESAGYDGDGISRLLDSHGYRLRTKLNQFAAGRLRLQTIYGQGYRLETYEDFPARHELVDVPETAD
jgi:DNA-binding response OmpR family regulator